MIIVVLVEGPLVPWFTLGSRTQKFVKLVIGRVAALALVECANGAAFVTVRWTVIHTKREMLNLIRKD